MSGLPVGWTESTLGRILALQYGKSLPERTRKPGGVPVYGSNGVVGSHEQPLISGPAVIVGRKGSVGEVHFSDGPCWPIDTTYFVNDVGDNSLEFWFWYLKHLRLAGLDRATAIPGLNREDAYKLRVAVPPPTEQRRIVAKFDSLFKCSKSAREELARIPRLVERYKRAVLASAFSGDVTTEWRKKQGLPKPKSTTLESLLEVPIRNGLSVRGSDEPPGFRSLRLSALRTGIVDFDDVRYLPITKEVANRYLLREGDVLVSRGNGTKSFVGIAALVQQVNNPTIFPDTAFRIRLARAHARPEWFTSIWNAPQVRTQIENAAKTTAGIWKVSQADLARITLIIPSPQEQDEIARRIDVWFARIEGVARETARALDLIGRCEQAILSKAFRGDLVSSAGPSAVDQRRVAQR